MKKIILYIDSMQYGGAQRVLKNIADFFADEGYSVILVNDIIPQADIPEYKCSKLIKRFFLNESSEKSSNMYRMKKLRSIVKQETPDVILSFLGPPNIRMLFATLGIRTKKIVSVRNDPYREYGFGLKKIFARFVFRFADGCVFQTSDAATYFSKKTIGKSRIIVNPVSEKFFEVEWFGDKKEIAVVGRLQPQKNPLLALEAFRLIEKDFPDYKLIYYGDDELKEDIINKSSEYRIEDKVIVFGKTNEIENRLAHSSVYLLSSDYEGMPNALLEAMAVGVPVVSTDCPCGGPKMIIRDHNEGKLVPCNDKIMMANAIRTIISDAELQKKISVAERRRALDFRESRVMLQWKEFLFS